MEFLIGRSLTNSLLNMDIHDAWQQRPAPARHRTGSDCATWEHDGRAGATGGLGRLAACFLDSMATLDLPGIGLTASASSTACSASASKTANSVEHPENWLAHGNPWEFPRPEVAYKVRFGGRVLEYQGPNGRRQFDWDRG